MICYFIHNFLQKVKWNGDKEGHVSLFVITPLELSFLSTFVESAFIFSYICVYNKYLHQSCFTLYLNLSQCCVYSINCLAYYMKHRVQYLGFFQLVKLVLNKNIKFSCLFVWNKNKNPFSTSYIWNHRQTTSIIKFLVSMK